jgi:hypothetical protein
MEMLERSSSPAAVLVDASNFGAAALAPLPGLVTS